MKCKNIRSSGKTLGMAPAHKIRAGKSFNLKSVTVFCFRQRLSNRKRQENARNLG